MSSSHNQPLELPAFRTALAQHSTRLKELTYWRYVQGFIPAFGRLIVAHPDLARALAADAERLAAQRGAEPPALEVLR